ncbi:MAG TPA: hypothetical protein VM713_09270 [Steroidobacteraceae bacterium]|nr:hypothetical protein [Steroidobacteraceae bacterium]
MREYLTDEAHALAATEGGVALNGAARGTFNAHAVAGRARNGTSQLIAL